ncbi:hypothetical protein HGRIS_010376 [Hohenbuehelia grisea]|uniref:EF-hand domain-containing protein n=1 Tax=Hohenbuehelia grisea TaxID=104357 RepID=A0ABR3J4J6_9AGAR
MTKSLTQKKLDETADAIEVIGNSLRKKSTRGDAEQSETGVTGGKEHSGQDEASERSNEKLLVAKVPFDEWRENCKLLMRVLSAVAEIHPFAAVAVGAFNAVIKLELTRRENSQKVVALYTSMNDMMSVLTCMKDIQATEVTLQSRLNALSTDIANDIQECANPVTVYLKSRSISKLFRLSEWASKFEGHVEAFSNHKVSLQQELTIISAANSAIMIKKLQGAANQFQAWGRRVEAYSFFKEQTSAKDAEMVLFIEENGGRERFLEDEGLMSQLLVKNNELYSSEQKAVARKMEDSQIVDDLKATWGQLVQMHAKELKDFTSKFEVLKDDMRNVFQEELRAAFPGHPRGGLLDSDIQEIWQKMGWKRQVKSRNFVIAIRDHFQEVLQSDDLKPPAAAKMRWALQYLSVSRLHSLIDSFDEDGSGFVTVKEVNDLTQLMPTDWSLPECLVYWSAGYHLAMIIYSDKIQSIIQTMHEQAELVLPENRAAVTEYLLVGPTVCESLVAGVHSRMDQLDRVTAWTRDSPIL